MQVTIGTGKRAQVWTIESRWESDGALIDFSNPEDMRKLTASHIKAMEAIGYTHVPNKAKEAA